MKVSGYVADLICIAQITWEMINSALSIQNWRLVFFGFKILGKISVQPHPTLCIQFLNRENNDKNNTFPLGKQICFTIVRGCAETLPDLVPILLSRKNRLQRTENFMAKITQLLPNCISGPLIFEWKTNSYYASTKKSSRQLWVGYTVRHLHQRIAEHKYSAIGRHFLEAHYSNHLLKENQFRVLRKCQGKFDCLVFEMLYIKNLKSNLNMQTDSISAKLFV